MNESKTLVEIFAEQSDDGVDYNSLFAELSQDDNDLTNFEKGEI